MTRRLLLNAWEERKHLLSNYAIPLRTVCKILTFLPKVTRLIFNLIGSKPTAGLTIPYYLTYGPQVLSLFLRYSLGGTLKSNL